MRNKTCYRLSYIQFHLASKKLMELLPEFAQNKVSLENAAQRLSEESGFRVTVSNLNLIIKKLNVGWRQEITSESPLARLFSKVYREIDELKKENTALKKDVQAMFDLVTANNRDK